MLVPVVNKNDDIIGYKNRDELDHANDIFRTSALWLVNSQDEVLIAQRKFNKKLEPGKWGEAVGGTVEGSDDYQSTIIREAKEELGIDLVDFEAGPKQFLELASYSLFVQWFIAKIDQPIDKFLVQESEVEAIAWINKDQLLLEIEEQPDKYVSMMKEIFQVIYKS